ncbi:MAG: putative transposase [Akkermansiaceae bacterium]|jgi:putative transposase
MDRFKSVLVDGEDALATMAAYIDLNPVRSGIVADPLDYEGSGYGEACAGSRRAKRQMSKALGHPQDLWEKEVCEGGGRENF